MISLFTEPHQRHAAPSSAPLLRTLMQTRWVIRRASTRGAGALLLILFSAPALMAITLTAYRERVRQAAVALDSLQAADEDADDGVGHAARIAATLRSVRDAVPGEETIEWNGTTQRVNNKWLDDELKKYEQALQSDPENAGALLARTTERLHALADRLDELAGDKASTAASTRKDEDKARLAAILRRDEYSQQNTQPSALKRLWERFLRWLNSLFPKSSKPLQLGPRTDWSRAAQIFVVALALALISYVVWRFKPYTYLRLQGQQRAKREARVVLGERLEPDQTAADILAEAERLARAGELRAAIRKGYIALLCELNDRKILRLAQHKTNRDYLRAVEEKSALHNEMQQLTTAFENHWYGLAPATENDWIAFRARYQQALKE